MSDLTVKQRLARLRECFPSDEVLCDHLDCKLGTLRKIMSDEKSPWDYTDVANKAKRLHEQIQKEHAAGLDAVSYALQTIERIRAGTMTDEKLDNVEKVLQQKADDLNTAYA